MRTGECPRRRSCPGPPIAPAITRSSPGRTTASAADDLRVAVFEKPPVQGELLMTVTGLSTPVFESGE
jgi:hypothetical protein